MTYEVIIRNEYYDNPDIYSHDGLDHHKDFKEFHIPMECMHNSNLHDWGIASGLEVSGTIGDSKVTIKAGVAIARKGQLISLSDEKGGIGANDPNSPLDLNKAVSPPVSLNTASMADKTVYVTIEFSEICLNASSIEDEPKRWQQVPWVRLRPIEGYVEDDKTVVLAIAKIDGSGNLKELKSRDDTPLPTPPPTLRYRRRLSGETIEELRIRRSIKDGDIVKEVRSGEIGPCDEGGLKITAETVVFKDSQERDTLKIDVEQAGLYVGSVQGYHGEIKIRDGIIGHEAAMYFTGNDATLRIGCSGNGGDIVVNDKNGTDVMNFIGNEAVLYIGNTNNEGNIVVKDNYGNEGARINGEKGTLSIKKIDSIPTGGAIDIDALSVNIKNNLNVTGVLKADGSQLSGITAKQVGALSINGGTINGNLAVSGDVTANRFLIGINELTGSKWKAVGSGISYNNGYVGIGLIEPQTKLHIVGNADLLRLEGTDHAYIQWYPKGYSQNRKAWMGFGDGNSDNFAIANETTIGRTMYGCKIVLGGGNDFGKWLVINPDELKKKEPIWWRNSGIHTGNIYAEDTIAVGGTDTNFAGYFDSSGHAYFPDILSKNIKSDNINVLNSIEVGYNVYAQHFIRTSDDGDMAEYYSADMDIEPGDVVCLDKNKDGIVISKKSNDVSVIGIISTRPGFLLNSNSNIENKKMFPVALCGRVPCKVVDENGQIQRGDLLTSSSTSGHAMKAIPIKIKDEELIRSGTIIGKALGTLKSGKGVIDIFVFSS